MKIYIAARIKTGSLQVKELAESLTSLGHKITYDWTKEVIPKPFSEHKDIAAPFALKMKDGATDCDIFILIWDESLLGALIELGMALGTSSKDKPKIIYILGKKERESIFETLPEFRIIENPQDVIDEIKRLSK